MSKRQRPSRPGGTGTDGSSQVAARRAHDRHRIATQLYQQAMASHIAFLFYTRMAAATSDHPSDHPSADPVLLAGVRRDLERRVETLRLLMVAVAPTEPAPTPADTLAAAIATYADHLDPGDERPTLDVTVDDIVELDWTTETILLSMIEDVLRSAWGRPDVCHVRVRVAVVDGAIDVRIDDDRLGSDAQADALETELAAVAALAARCDGSLEITSNSRGTVVTTRLRMPGPAPLSIPRWSAAREHEPPPAARVVPFRLASR